MITSSMYIGKVPQFSIRNQTNIGGVAIAAVDTVGAQFRPNHDLTDHWQTLAISQVFFLLMAIHPEIQKKAQREIDQLLGRERLPTLADQDHLPYISALIKEIYRWHTPLPISIPKSLREADDYKGYHLPKGATIVENVWAVFHDPVMYPEPHVFIPERFLKDGKLDPSVRNPDDRVFGSARRICPGKYFANRTIFLRVATILATFDIEPGVNEDGGVESEVRVIDGIVR
jgi:cytochrome P450